METNKQKITVKSIKGKRPAIYLGDKNWGYFTRVRLKQLREAIDEFFKSKSITQND